MHSAASATYGAFLSFTRKGHPDLARRIYQALDQAGIRVFADWGIREGEPISDEIITALAQSMTLIAVYCEPYQKRNACQEELRRVFIAAEAEGDPSRRIIVVNPEEGNDHIVPAELRDARYVAARGPDADLTGLIRAVRDRTACLPGPMSMIKHADPPLWLPPRIPGAPGFIGRHGDLWRLHTALRAPDFPLTHATSFGLAAVVAGMAGIGKTSLAYAYAWRFGPAYPGGVYRANLTGATDAQAAVAQHTEEIHRILASLIGPLVNGSDREQMQVLMGGHIDSQPGRSLWIIDDLPPGLDPQILHQLVIPARRVRTIFTSRDTSYGAQAVLVSLDGLTPADGEALLKASRPVAGTEDRDAARLITERLGGHPIALQVAAADLRNRQGLKSYAEYAATLAPDHDVLSLIGESIGMLTPDERTIVELAGVLESQPLPAPLIEAVLSAVTDTAGPPADAGQALDRLETLALARREGTIWSIHPLVSDAARIAGPAPASPSALTFAAARGIFALAGSPQADGGMIRLARTLAASPVLQNTAEADLLRRLLADHYEALGDVVQAARLRRRLAASQPDSPRDLTAAALACNACGEHADAADLAQRALAFERAFPARWALAEALDGLARYAEADTIWQDLDNADLPPSTPQAQQIAYEVARSRAHLARGQLREASVRLEGIRARHAIETADSAAVHQINSATVQLAILCLQTSREREGRQLARSVVTFYRSHNAEKHAICLQAEMAWAEAAVSLPLFELKIDKNSWAEAEKNLQRLYDSYWESAGPDSGLTLRIAVQHALILIRVGKRNKQVFQIINEILPKIQNRYGRNHPLWLRCHYIRGLAYLRQNQFEDACPLLETAWAGQREVLGPRHPETLITQLELGCLLKLSDVPRSRQLVSEVRQALPGVTGWKNDMYGRALAASAMLIVMPSPAVRWLWKLSNRMDYTDPDGW